MSTNENNENAGFHASRQTKRPDESAVTEDSPARSDGRSAETAPSFNCGEIWTIKSRVPVSSFSSIEDPSIKTIQEKRIQGKTGSALEISCSEWSPSKSNGSSSNPVMESISFAGDQGEPSPETVKRRNEKEGEINGRKNHQPSNEKIGRVSSTRTTGEPSPETIRMDFDTAVMPESPQEETKTSSFNSQGKEGISSQQKANIQAEVGSPHRYRQRESEMLLTAMRGNKSPLTTEAGSLNSRQSGSISPVPWTDDVRKPTTQQKLVRTQPLTSVELKKKGQNQLTKSQLPTEKTRTSDPFQLSNAVNSLNERTVAHHLQLPGFADPARDRTPSASCFGSTEGSAASGTEGSKKTAGEEAAEETHEMSEGDTRKEQGQVMSPIQLINTIGRQICTASW